MSRAGSARLPHHSRVYIACIYYIFDMHGVDSYYSMYVCTYMYSTSTVYALDLKHFRGLEDREFKSTLLYIAYRTYSLTN